MGRDSQKIQITASSLAGHESFNKIKLEDKLETPKTNAGMLTEKFMMNNFWENSPNQICNLTTQQYNKLYQQIHSLIRRRNLIEFLNEKEEDESVPAETVVGQVSASSANGEFCGNCTYLSCTESEQNSSPDKKGDIHFCYLFKSIIFHRGQHPNLPKLDGCKIIGKR